MPTIILRLRSPFATMIKIEGAPSITVDDFPQDAANWTGRKVGEVEDIPQDIEGDYDRAKWRAEDRVDDAVQDVADFPQDVGDDVANWAGRDVGDVERFDDNVDNAFDQGEVEGRDGW